MKQKETVKFKKIIPWLGLASMALCLSSANASAELTSIPETIDLNLQANHANIEGLPKDKKAVNGFTHKKHADEYVKGNSDHAAQTFTDAFTCAACHTEASKTEDITGTPAQERLVAALTAKGGPKNTKKYFHDICLNCHKSMNKAQKTTGPTKCNDCHSRK